MEGLSFDIVQKSPARRFPWAVGSVWMDRRRDPIESHAVLRRRRVLADHLLGGLSSASKRRECASCYSSPRRGPHRRRRARLDHLTPQNPRPRFNPYRPPPSLPRRRTHSLQRLQLRRPGRQRRPRRHPSGWSGVIKVETPAGTTLR